LTNGFVRVIFEDHWTNLWIGTDWGLFRFDAGKLTRVDNQTGIPSMSVHAMHEDSAEALGWRSGLVVLRRCCCGIPFERSCRR
jgi:ligand-binding sensor domain-containing protein